MPETLTVGSLFSGIGGLDLGLEWAGFETKWFCEIEQFPQKVLKKHWPEVPIYNDVRQITTDTVIPVDVIVGGFPCQDISWAGLGRGIDYNLSEQEGTRSGLWWEMWRVIRDLRPRYVIAENVPALTHRGLDIVLGSLAKIGYDAEWQTISAASVGAPHIRERVFIVAHRNNGGMEVRRSDNASEGKGRGQGVIQSNTIRVRKEQAGEALAHPDSIGYLQQRGKGNGKKEGRGESFSTKRSENRQQPEGSCVGKKVVAHSNGEGFQGRREQHTGKDRCAWSEGFRGQPDWFAGPSKQPHPVSFRLDRNTSRINENTYSRMARQSGNRPPGRVRGKESKGDGWVEVEYDFRGVAYGVSDRVGALKGYGNAVVPQVGYLVGRAVMEHFLENGGRDA